MAVTRGYPNILEFHGFDNELDVYVATPNTTHSPNAECTKIAPSLWGVAMGIYIGVYVSYSVTLAFYAASFPRLAHNTRHIRELREMCEQGEVPVDVYEQEEGLERSKISSLSMARILLVRPSPVVKITFCFRRLAPLASS